MNELSDIEIPATWIWVQLTDALSEPLINGRSVKTMEGGFPVLRLTALKPGGVDFLEHKAGAWTAEQAAPFRATKGDFLLSRGNGSLRLVGRGALVRHTPLDVAFPDTMIRVRTRSDVIDPEYLSHIWDSPLVRNQIEKSARTTAGIYKINQDTLRKIRFPLPPLTEQYRIVEALEGHLSRLDAANADMRKSIARLPALRDGIRDVVTRGHRPEETLPANWSRGRLADVLVRIEAGKSFRCEARPATDEEWGVIKVSAMTWGEFRAGEQKAVPEGREVDPRHEIKPGDILVSRANTPAYVGAPVLVKDYRPRLLLSDKSLRLIPRPGVDKTWLIQTLASPNVRKQISAKATGTKDSMRNISQRDLLEVRIPIPPTDTQALLGEILENEIERVNSLTSSLSIAEIRANRLQRALFNRAFSGQLVPQNPTDEPASLLLDRIRTEREGDARNLKRATRQISNTVAAAKASSPSAVPTADVQQELPL